MCEQPDPMFTVIPDLKHPVWSDLSRFLQSQSFLPFFGERPSPSSTSLGMESLAPSYASLPPLAPSSVLSTKELTSSTKLPQTPRFPPALAMCPDTAQGTQES